MFLKHGESLLAGASAPDDQFKDFRNHVVHVREKCWGGAVESAETWYRHTVEALQGKQWAKAAFAAGTLSHYYADPLMPLHTAQTEEAGIVHRACDRSVFRSYDVLTAILERDLGGYPQIKTPTGPRWLAEMVKTGARLSHEHYDVVIDHYNIQKGWRNPTAGLDDELRVSLAECLGHAVVGIARILDRAIDAAGVPAPKSGIAIAGASAWFRIPAMRWKRGRAAARERRIVKAAFKEFRKSGKVTPRPAGRRKDGSPSSRRRRARHHAGNTGRNQATAGRDQARHGYVSAPDERRFRPGGLHRDASQSGERIVKLNRKRGTSRRFKQESVRWFEF